MDVSGKTVLLTGGSGGIGGEIATQLKAKGANVFVTGRNPDRLAGMEAEGFGTISASLNNAAGVDALIAEWGDREIDILINNAGQGVDHDWRDGDPDPDETDDCFYANLSAPVRLITSFVPKLRTRPRAAIVNVTSGLAIAPNSGGPVYCGTKAGLRSFTMALRKQLEDTPVHVIEALPPVVATQMTASRGGKKMSPQECARQIVEAIEKDRDEANIGMVRFLRSIYSVSPALARSILLRF